MKLENIFEFKDTDPKGKYTTSDFREQFYILHCSIMQLVEHNRERSLAITKLEESAMWLNKAISRSEKHDRQ